MTTPPKETAVTPWRNRNGGRFWRLTNLGIETKDAGYLRTGGTPATMIRLWEDYGASISYASRTLGCPADMIAAMIPIEAVRGADGSFNPKSNRFEPGYTSDAETPHRRSPGLMQTLISTASRMAATYPALGIQEEAVTTEMLYDPHYSILLGSCYIRHLIDVYGADPILICGAYNAGAVKQDPGNPWHILSFGKTRMDRYSAWFNDLHFAIRQGLVKVEPGVLFSLPTG
jgi:hypothetical protein